MVRLLIGADLVPTKNNIDLFDEGAINELIGTEIVRIFNIADYRIINLEVPLVD